MTLRVSKISERCHVVRLADKITVALEAPGVATNLPATGILSASLGDSFFCVTCTHALLQLLKSFGIPVGEEPILENLPEDLYGIKVWRVWRQI